MIIDDIALTMQPLVGAKTAIHLIDVFRSAEAVFAASVDELTTRAELNERIARELVKKSYHRQAEREVTHAAKNGIHIIAATDPIYPQLLRESNDYPHVIYFKGDLNVLNQRMLTMVGTRNMTSYGQSLCNKIIEQLSQLFPDLVIVSGLALGVDGTCHRAALAFGLHTIGVIANPIHQITPRSHIALSEQMVKQGGGILSELHSGCDPKGHGFVPRNRIVAALSMGTVVVQSPSNGGSLITAQMADGYNRVVMAIPGRIEDTLSAGCNSLIKNRKAAMICSGEDIAREMGWDFAPSAQPPATILSKDAQGLLSCIKEGEIMAIDQLLEISGLSFSEFSAVLIELQFESLIRELPGKYYERA